jgi:CubicO group peptidase (beta-lactamase class C family)
MSVPVAQINQLFHEWNSATSPGCALGIIDHGELVYARGYGMANLELGVPITPDSVFYLASVSKQFTCTAILLLAEAGRLTLADNVRTYVPEVPDYGVTITVEQLMRHTSGLRDYLALGQLAGKRFADVWSEADFLQRVSRQRALNFAPGTQYLYSNTGYVLLSLIIKRVSGQSLGAFAQEQIFQPLGMTHTVFKEDYQQLIPNRVSGYSLADDGTLRNEYHNLQVAGDGGLYSSVVDLARWDANFYANRLGQGSPALIQQLYSTVPLADGTPQSYALGLGHDSYRGLPIIKHGGGLNGARTQMVRFPEQRCTIICLANLTSFDPEALIRRVADLYLADRLGPQDATAADKATQPVVTPLQLSAADLNVYCGHYDSAELAVGYDLTIEQEKLVLRYGDQGPIGLQPTVTDHFGDDDERHFTFERDADGAVVGFGLSNGRVQNIRFAKVTVTAHEHSIIPNADGQ